MADKHTMQSAKIPKQIDAEVLFFRGYTVRQWIPAIVLTGVWYSGLVSMNQGAALYIMTVFFLLSAVILGKRMGNLILYEYMLLFFRFIFLKTKLFLRVSKDESYEPNVFQPEYEDQPKKMNLPPFVVKMQSAVELLFGSPKKK